MWSTATSDLARPGDRIRRLCGNQYLGPAELPDLCDSHDDQLPPVVRAGARSVRRVFNLNRA